MLTIRCSSLPRIMACPQSLNTETQISYESQAASRGTEIHKRAARLVIGMEPNYNDEDEELQFLTRRLQSCWSTLAGSYPSPIVEYHMKTSINEDVMLEGTADLVSFLGSHARLLDWKTGIPGGYDYRDQMSGYASLILLTHPGLGSVNCVVCWLRTGELNQFPVTLADAEEFVGRLGERISNKQFAPGQHCAYCPRKVECPALLAEMRALQTVSGQTSLTEPDKLTRAYDMISTMEKSLDRMREAIKARVFENGGSVEGADGSLELVETSRRRVIPSIAMLRNIADAGAVSSVELKIGELSRAFKLRAEGALEEWAQRNDGSVETTTFQRLQRKRP